MFLERATGVPVYVAQLYRKCLEIDPVNQYVFFQPNRSRTLGTTKTARVPRGLLGAALFDNLRVQRLIRQEQLDVFHGPSHFLPLRKCPGVKYVVTIHDLAYQIMPWQYNLRHRWYFGWQLARSLKLADAIVAVSRNTQRDLMRIYHLPEERIQVVHHGVAERFFRATAQPGERLIGDKYFFSVTTHPMRKNVLGALKAFALFAGQSRLKYVVAGVIDERQRKEFLASADRLGVRNKVTLFGYADDDQLINLYRNAEFLIYPSFYEGFGFPVVEAMACGCPVITSNTSSLPELMPDDEWLVDPYQPADMAGKMQRLLALTPDQRRELMEKNQKHAREFDWDKTACQMIEIFTQLQKAKK